MELSVLTEPQRILNQIPKTEFGTKQVAYGRVRRKVVNGSTEVDSKYQSDLTEPQGK